MSETTKYDGKYIQVTEEMIENYTWEKVYMPDSLVVLPITENNEIIFIEEHRPHETPAKRLKLVTGHIDGEEDPLIAANREMQEEIGVKANEISEIMVHHSTGTINSKFYYILAKDLIESKLPNPDGEETILSIKKIPMEKIKAMLFADEIPWSLSTLGLFRILK